MSQLKSLRPEMFTSKAKQEAATGDVKTWLMESAEFRASKLYPDDANDMKGVPKNEEHRFRKYCLWYEDQDKATLGKGSPSRVDEKDMPVISDEYVQQNLKKVESQLLVAGLRLASLIDGIAKTIYKNDPQAKRISNQEQEKILKNLQDAFKH